MRFNKCFSIFLLLFEYFCGIIKIRLSQKGWMIDMSVIVNPKDVAYEGHLGKFTYNTGEFELCKRYAETGTFDVLMYRGNAREGSEIQIPEGIVNISYMFENKSLRTPPSIPATVKVADYAFKDCMSLIQGAALPYGLESCGFLYKNCRSMMCGSNMPDTVVSAPYMYDGCTSLYEPGTLSQNLRYASGLYRDCKNLRVMPELPPSVERADYMLKGCDYLNKNAHDRMY